MAVRKGQVNRKEPERESIPNACHPLASTVCSLGGGNLCQGKTCPNTGRALVGRGRVPHLCLSTCWCQRQAQRMRFHWRGVILQSQNGNKNLWILTRYAQRAFDGWILFSWTVKQHPTTCFKNTRQWELLPKVEERKKVVIQHKGRASLAWRMWTVESASALGLFLSGAVKWTRMLYRGLSCTPTWPLTISFLLSSLSSKINCIIQGCLICVGF